MPYRPYPRADRARRQLDRHHQAVTAPPVSEISLRLAEQARAALAHAGRTLGPLAEQLRQQAEQPRLLIPPLLIKR